MLVDRIMPACLIVIVCSVRSALIVRVASLSDDTLRLIVTLGYECGPLAQVASAPNRKKCSVPYRPLPHHVCFVCFDGIGAILIPI